MLTGNARIAANASRTRFINGSISERKPLALTVTSPGERKRIAPFDWHHIAGRLFSDGDVYSAPGVSEITARLCINCHNSYARLQTRSAQTFTLASARPSLCRVARHRHFRALASLGLAEGVFAWLPENRKWL